MMTQTVCLSVALAHNGDGDKGRNEEEERDAQMEDKASVCAWCVSCRLFYIECTCIYGEEVT